MSAKKNVLKLSSPETRQYWEVPVLYEDDTLLAIDKPAGILTAPDPDEPERPSLTALIHKHVERGVPWATERNLEWVRHVKAVDTDTTGIVTYGKTPEAVAAIQDQINSRTPVTTCNVLARSTPMEDKAEVDIKIARNRKDPTQFCLSPAKGKQSLTKVRVIERFTPCFLLECDPMPDRPHQISLHLRHLGAPVIGDEIYGGDVLLLSQLKQDYRLKKNQTEHPLMARPAIHNSAMRFKHPKSGEPVEILCELPKDFQVSLKYLRRYAISSTAGPDSRR